MEQKPSTRIRQFRPNCSLCGAAVSVPLYQLGPNLACDSTAVVYTDRLNFIWIGILRRPHGMRNHWNVALSTKFLHFVVLVPLYWSRPNLALKRPAVYAYILIFSWICCVPSREKNSNLGQFFKFGKGKGSCTQPLLSIQAKFGGLC